LTQSKKPKNGCFTSLLNKKMGKLDYEKKNLKEYRKFVEKRIGKLFPVFSKTSVGDFSRQIRLPLEEDEFTPLYVGTNMMIQLIREKMAELENLNKKLEKRVVKRTAQVVLTNQSLRKELSTRKGAETGLRESEERYATLVEKGNDGIVIIQDRTLKFVNEKMVKLTSFKIADAIGRPFTDFISPEYRDLALRNHKLRLMGKPVPITYEIEILTKKGEKVPVEINASLIEYRGRKASMAIIRDISDRREVEKTLQEEKGKLDAIYKTIKDGLALYDIDGRVLFMNPSLKKLFGVKTNLFGVERVKIAKNRRKYFKYYLERYDDSLETQRQVYAGRPVSNVLMKVYSSPPKYVEGNYVPIKDNLGKVIGMSASFRDVTVLKNQSEKIAKQLLEMEKQKERVQAIFNNVEEGVYIFDKNLKIIQANSACEIMTGCEEKEMIGKTYYEIFGCHDRVGHFYPEFDPVSKVITTKESVPYDEHLHTSKNGKQRWVGVSYTPIFNEAGDIEQIVGVVRDITAIKELEKAKSEFVSVASHELRTPLTVINGYLSLLLNGDLGKLESEKSRLTFFTILNKVKYETERLTKLVGELLNVSRIEEGRLRLVLRKLPIIKLVDEITSDFKAMAAMKGVRLQVIHKVRENGRDYYVMADQDKLKEILVNLLDNAIKFTESGGEIVISCTEKKGQIDIGVKDTGVGIESTMLPRVFDKFQQISGSYLKENKGTGLGLFIVKSLVELHKGKIWVESEVGAGTEFNFSLPLVPQ